MECYVIKINTWLYKSRITFIGRPKRIKHHNYLQIYYFKIKTIFSFTYIFFRVLASLTKNPYILGFRIIKQEE